jgi:hypothetical protein
MKTKWFVFGLMAILCGFGVIALLNRPAKPTSIAQRPVNAVQSVSVAPPVSETVPAEPVKESVPPTLKPKSSSPTPAQNTPSTSVANPPKEPLHDPVAREALAFVGMDPLAEQYWLDAIFDTSLPDTEREDLMEDLNETGFADLKNPTVDDLLLIMNRLQIIDAVLPDADDFMADHLLEAQKDLVNMFAQGAP